MIKIWIIISMFLFSQVNSHGRILSPIPRNGNHNGQGCFVSWDQHYLNGFKCNNVCGNKVGIETGEIDPQYENTGPIKAIYKMGQTIEIKFDQTGHLGYTRFKLCKLTSPKDMVTQECLDQNLLELSNLKSNHMLLKDKYEIRKPLWYVENATVEIKLPDGLACDNCVLQYEWITTHKSCYYENGTPAPTVYCMNQVYKNCVDIKIEEDPFRPNQVYKPNLVKDIFPPKDRKSHPPVFWMEAWPHMKKDANGQLLRPERPDELAYIGTGLVCFAYDNYIFNTFDAVPAYQKLCRENCMSKSKTCPSECACRWFNWI